MSYAQKAYNTPEGMHFKELRQTCQLFVIAGSETTATLLSGVTYLLSKNQESYRKLVDEIRQAFNSEDQINITNTDSLKYESAVLEEALRIFPPVGGSQCRFTPPDGHIISGQHVPGNTIVGVNQWSANHASLHFRDPYKFIPERWLGDPKYKDDKRKVVQPFSVGPRNCIGLNLAYAEMRVILARILWNFDIELCEESRDWMDRLEVYTLWKKETMMVKLAPVVRSAAS
jgi:cytochrome P450